MVAIIEARGHNETHKGGMVCRLCNWLQKTGYDPAAIYKVEINDEAHTMTIYQNALNVEGRFYKDIMGNIARRLPVTIPYNGEAGWA